MYRTVIIIIALVHSYAHIDHTTSSHRAGIAYYKFILFFILL